MATGKSNFLKANRATPNLPWCEKDPDKLGELVFQLVLDHEPFMRAWCQKWYENFQFIYGNQNLRWSPRFDFAVDSDFLKRSSPMSVQAQTNTSRVVCEALASLLYSNLPDWEAETAEEGNQKGQRYQKIVTKILDCYMERLLMDKEFAAAALVLSSFGQVASYVGWDYTSGQLIGKPQHRKVKTPIYTDYMADNQGMGLLEAPVPALGMSNTPYMEDSWEPIIGPDGKQVIIHSATGDCYIDIMTPFEYARAPSSKGMHKTPWVRRVRLMDYYEYLKFFDKHPGKTKHFDSVTPQIQDGQLYDFALRHYMRLQFAAPPSLADRDRRRPEAIRHNIMHRMVVVIEHFDAPNEEMWPKGRKLVVVNRRCTHMSEPQYTTNKLDGWHPMSEAQWMCLPPNSISAGPMNDVIAKNREINQFDGLIATSARRNLGSLLLVKTGGNLDKNKFTGEPAQVLETTNLDSVRWVHDQNPIPPVISELKNQLKEEIYEVSGAGDSIRGDRTKGVSAGYALRQLQEREERRLTPVRKGFENFGGSTGEKLIACLKQNAPRLNDDVIGFLKRSAAGEFQIQDVVGFLKADIDYGIDVRIKAGSMALRSKATLQATLMDLAKGPAAQRLQQDAVCLDNFLKFFDAEALRDSAAPHRDRCQRENEVFMDFAKGGDENDGLRLPIVIFEDDDDIHMAGHTDHFVRNSDEILANPKLLQAIILHNEIHRVQKKEKAGEVPPGTALQVPAMFQQAQIKPPPNAPVIYQQQQQRQIQQQQSQAMMAQQGQGRPGPGPAQPGPGNKAPSAPSQPAPPGSKGPRQTDPSAPSGNTPSGRASAATQGGNMP